MSFKICNLNLLQMGKISLQRGKPCRITHSPSTIYQNPNDLTKSLAEENMYAFDGLNLVFRKVEN